eukprot:4629324-Amphidinium_carterae.1
MCIRDRPLHEVKLVSRMRQLAADSLSLSSKFWAVGMIGLEMIPLSSDSNKSRLGSLFVIYLNTARTGVILSIRLTFEGWSVNTSGSSKSVKALTVKPLSAILYEMRI